MTQNNKRAAVRRFYPAVLLLTLACDAEPLYYYVDQPLDSEQRDYIAEAEGLIGHEMIRARSKYGALHIQFDPPDSFPLADSELFDCDTWVLGEAYDRQRDCTRWIRVAHPSSHPDFMGVIIAHEAGHAFRFDHTGDPYDVMGSVHYEDDPPDHFGAQDKLDRRINAFTRLCLR